MLPGNKRSEFAKVYCIHEFWTAGGSIRWKQKKGEAEDGSRKAGALGRWILSGTHRRNWKFMLFMIQNKRKLARCKEILMVWIDENFRRIYNGMVRAEEYRALC
ncbi:MAG: hypothetical protein LKG42_05385 [Eubacterium sp.]|jgi:hypothetical protein|nr:hypothetical protein [Eubacterium sp.]MCH4046516.1 hypothetical protein [Eubacterium sp.]MCH4079611.1 hypothetical protein [Eubacterium sp.]MCH4110170.1 hypothetical protein [Eubacterium sp.]MCI1307432.1 hypothetical protein [Eubacterium sp.]